MEYIVFNQCIQKFDWGIFYMICIICICFIVLRIKHNKIPKITHLNTNLMELYNPRYVFQFTLKFKSPFLPLLYFNGNHNYYPPSVESGRPHPSPHFLTMTSSNAYYVLRLLLSYHTFLLCFQFLSYVSLKFPVLIFLTSCRQWAAVRDPSTGLLFS